MPKTFRFRNYPIASMYSVFTHIYHHFFLNVGMCTLYDLGTLQSCFAPEACLGPWVISPLKKSRRWFQICFMFTPIWGRFQFWLIFFKWVGSTTVKVTPPPRKLAAGRFTSRYLGIAHRYRFPDFFLENSDLAFPAGKVCFFLQG